METIDDKQIYKDELEFWQKYYGTLIKEADSPERADFYKELLKEKEKELEEIING